MIINSHLSSHNEVLPLIKSGADSFYCGLVSSNEWVENRRDFELINRRPDYGANFTGIKNLYKAKKTIDRYCKELAVVFNEFYPQAHLEKVKPLLRAIDSIGINKIIISDLGLLKYITSTFNNFEITVSIMASVFNSQTVSLIKEISPALKRIILPYHLDFEEMRQIISDFPQISFETFIFNELCHYEVGLCSFMHGHNRRILPVSFVKRNSLIDSFCQHVFQNYLPYSLQNMLFRKFMVYPCYLRHEYVRVVCEGLDSEKRDLLKDSIVSCLDTYRTVFGCYVCFIPELRTAGIKSVKIGGRNNSLKKKILNVKFVKDCINLISDFKYNRYQDYRAECIKRYSKLFSNKTGSDLYCNSGSCHVQ
jgi:collagenase-like PrtC family protease